MVSGKLMHQEDKPGQDVKHLRTAVITSLNENLHVNIRKGLSTTTIPVYRAFCGTLFSLTHSVQKTQTIFTLQS